MAFAFANHLHGQNAFITTWKTDNAGASCSSCISIPTLSTLPNTVYNYDVDWNNDGVYDELNIEGDITHDFGVAGTYTIAIRGEFPRISFKGETDKYKLMNISQWGDIEWSGMARAFEGCENMECDAIDSPNLTNVSTTNSMFSGCQSFNGDLKDWDVSNVTSMHSMFFMCNIFNSELKLWNTSNVTNMQSMFSHCYALNSDLSNWDVSNVTNMNSMFFVCTAFNSDISLWDVSNVENFRSMFSVCENFNQNLNNWNVSNGKTFKSMFVNCYLFNQDLNDWDVSNATDLSYLFFNCNEFQGDVSNWNVGSATDLASVFSGCKKFNGDISNWDVSQATTISEIFRNCSTFNGDLSSWNVSNVNRMLSAFLGCTNFTGNIDSWDVSNVTDMGFMFNDCINFNGDISAWNVGNAAYINSMFSGATSFNQDISTWNVSKAINMHNIFENALSFDQDLSSWDFPLIERAESMLDNCGMSCSNYSSSLEGWASIPDIANNIELGAEALYYDEDVAMARETLISKGWTISGDTETDCTVSTSDNTTTSINVFPNPTNSYLHLDIDRAFRAKLKDMSGKLILEINNLSTIDISYISSGLYFLEIDNDFDHSFTTKKVLKY